ncbi:MAG TPA: hypothetical protein ENL03_00480, partial [Phycisphaerae bacterium]|nr:hypothetical protein [Phycisphaerae bacterium]
MKNWLLPCCILLLPALSAAEVGDLTHVACPRPGLTAVRGSTRVILSKPSPTADLVHPKALAGSVKLYGDTSVYFAIDGETEKAGTLDVLCIDITGTGTFKDAARVKLTKVKGGRSMTFTGLAPTKLRIENADITAMLVSAQYYPPRKKSYPANLTISIQMARQGTCQFGLKTHAIRIYDRNGDWQCGDQLKTPADKQFLPKKWYHGDTFMIDFGDGSFGDSAKEYYWGQPVFVDGKWYKLKLSPDGKKVQASPVELQAGRIAYASEKWSLIMTAKDRSYININGGPQGAVVPAGEYTMVSFHEWTAPDAKGKRGRIKYRTPSGLKARKLVFKEGKVTSVPAGHPLIAKISITSSGT